MDRRKLLMTGGVAAASAAAALLFRRRSPTEAQGMTVPSGPLAVANGLKLTVLSRAGSPLSDGTQSAHAPDGMACFPLADGTWALMRNHELSREQELSSHPKAPAAVAFDPKRFGGVQRLVLAPGDLRVISSNTVLAGTDLNCGGGPSPFGYLSCEESRETGHGYVFRVSVEAKEILPAEPIPAYGRYRHEGVAVDPKTRSAYLTQDEDESCLYRFTPDRPDTPFVGKLEALRVKDTLGFDVSRDLRPGRRLAVDWVPLLDPEGKDQSVKDQAVGGGAALIRRGEGIWLDQDSVVFCSTSGGPRGAGQVIRHRFGADGGELEVLAEATEKNSLNFPDNVTLAPWGDVIIAEDADSGCALRGIRPDGKVYLIAQNTKTDSELAGVCFSPDGSTLFVNLQADGLTVALRGPIQALRDSAG